MIDDSATPPITNHAAMGQTASARSSQQPFPSPTRTPRVLLRRRDSGSGLLDGAWWPRTANLTSELHDLITVLTPQARSPGPGRIRLEREESRATPDR
ncbi:DUF5994 family protein [Nocardia sp. CY41]|uniref:DUF5994 family protein n=1 Tax=Nocardia sp. CY41 TaxID=2608686 RepID=UPI003FA5823F